MIHETILERIGKTPLVRVLIWTRNDKSELLTMDGRTGPRGQTGKGVWSAMQSTWVAIVLFRLCQLTIAINSLQMRLVAQPILRPWADR